METLLAFLLVIGPLIFFHELGHFLVAKWRGVRVERFSLGYPPRLFGIKRGDTDYCVSALPLGGYVKMAGENPEEPTAGAPDEFMSKSLGSRALIIFAGPAANYILAFLLYFAIVFVGGELVIVEKGLRIGEMTPDWPAEQAGLQTGDRMLAVDGEPLADFEALREHVGPRPDVPLELTVERGTDTLNFSIVPKLTTDPQTGEEAGKIGIYPSTGFESRGLLQSLESGAVVTWEYTVMVTRFFGRFVSGKESPRNIGGPLFIASVAGKVADQGWRYFLGFMALLSINLAILNILPIPVLDGGQLLFILIEKIRRKPLSLKQRIKIQQVGLAFLLVLIIFVTINDILRELS
jgi:regulator of sigma E protease